MNHRIPESSVGNLNAPQPFLETHLVAVYFVNAALSTVCRNK
jgi:hypothetical protein